MIRKQKHKGRVGIIAHEQPKSAVSEQYRNIRTNIQFSAVDSTIRSLMVTSANAGEGKTTTAVNLAVVFAQQGKKVLLVDTDLRKPALHEELRTDNNRGITSVLSKQATLEKCIRKTKESNLDFLPCGVIPPNPAELLGSAAMEDFLKEAYSRYDLVLFDTPPALVVTDAQVMANQCDGIILVVRSGRTEREKVMKATALLQHAKGKMLGAVLNDIKQKENGSYYYMQK
ncbi:CpsD/CapB family tyrosine-protein kinase [Bacillus sp. 165]|uniref:CpsD/CapB family tyrosine-protein kinase n=1 Tax=Bacillus sp. 165 TaxID=1529117 RepID=UPI001ADB174D|nr:CpsD/CapB family tyrosine-protein kinase [Bacillus sp. 165]MBO9130001.1 CpsD/CapB family tyrosine-protein kinase [Bacillus sp. 165]